MSPSQAFIVDASLAGAAKWLRLMGYDTVVHQGEAGRLMMRRANQEKRILLTRRRDMIERQFSGRIFLVPETGVGQQLQYIVGKLSLKISVRKMLQICLICNQRLHPVERAEVCNLVPPHVFEHCRDFNRCDVCGKIYWKGTHVKNALEFLAKNNMIIK